MHRWDEMSKQFIQMTSGWIPIAVMTLLAVALIAGQAQANLPNELRAVPAPAMTTSVKIVLNAQMLKRLESLPAAVDTLLAMPKDIDLRVKTRILRRDVSEKNVSPLKSN